MKQLWQKVSVFFRQETVLCVAGLCAVVTAFFVPPSLHYLEYLDFRVLSLLFCLMAVVSGLGQAGLFERLSRRLTAGLKGSRVLVLALVMLCFFSSMIITNDVALLTFVPFAVLTLTGVGQQKQILVTVVLQTIAANLGSMLTPVGNPQNLYLYSYYEMSMGEFFSVTLPVTLLSLVLLAGGCLLLPNEPVTLPPSEEVRLDQKRLWRFGALLICCLLTVFRILPWPVMLVVVAAVMLLFDRPLFGRVDYSLLLTFVFFFIFVGNMGEIPAVRELISPLVQGRELWAGLLASQVISNVPAAVLLSTFTEGGRGLLLGVNIGGLGTLIASLASLISYRIYGHTVGARPGRYLAVFTLMNLAALVPLCLLGGLLA